MASSKINGNHHERGVNMHVFVQNSKSVAIAGTSFRTGHIYIYIYIINMALQLNR